MKRFHVHVNVADLATSIGYYQTLFGCAPNVVQPDYAKWMLDDPRVNFAISQRGRAPGVDHLGVQADGVEELEAIGARLSAADAVTLVEQDTTCCYARSDKFWSVDPQGLRWESFRSVGGATSYYAPEHVQSVGACCGPELNVASAASPRCCGPQPVAGSDCRTPAPQSGGCCASR